MRPLFYISLILLFTNCQDSIKTSEETRPTQTSTSPDTSIISKAISDEMPGSAYRKRATAYFVSIGSDSSDYMPIFSEAKEGGKVSLDLNISYFKHSRSMKERMLELKMILPKAALDYAFDSLTWISIGRLVLTGDLAIEITEEYKNKVGKPKAIRTVDYKEISGFLKGSKLGTTFNDLFSPYGLSVEQISVEKVFFSNKKEFISLKLTTDRDSSNYPEQILDCITGIRLKKE